MTLPPTVERALTELVGRLATTDILWALTGSTSHALQRVPLTPADIDVQTDAAGAYRIAQLFADAMVRPVTLRESDRIRSHFGGLILHDVNVELMGDMQMRRPDGSWAPAPDLAAVRHFITWRGHTLPVLDLAHERGAYHQMGRHERAELLSRYISAPGNASGP